MRPAVSPLQSVWLTPAARSLIHDVKQRWAVAEGETREGERPAERLAASRSGWWRIPSIPDAATSSQTFRGPLVRWPDRDGSARSIGGSELHRQTGCFDRGIEARTPHAVNGREGLFEAAACKVAEGNLVRLEKDLLRRLDRRNPGSTILPAHPPCEAERGRMHRQFTIPKRPSSACRDGGCRGVSTLAPPRWTAGQGSAGSETSETAQAQLLQIELLL